MYGAGLDFSGISGTVSTAQIADSAVTTAKINDAAVSLAKMANLATDRLIGRVSSGTGVPEAVTFGDGGQALADDASADAALTTLGFPATFIHKSASRCLYPEVGVPGGTIVTIANTAYFVYLGQTPRALTLNHVGALLTAASTTDSVGEVGFFTTPLAGGSKADQTLTPVATAFKTAIDDMTTGAVKRVGNSVAMAAPVAAGVHLWAGIRTNTGGNEPTLRGILDVVTGSVLVLTSAAAFDGTTTYAGVRPAGAATAVAPFLWAELD